jgi:hypothetical protein
MPAWVQDDDIWEKAKNAVDPAKYSGDAYWKVVTTVYQSMGGRVGQGKAAMRKRAEFLRTHRHPDEDKQRQGLGHADDPWPT